MSGSMNGSFPVLDDHQERSVRDARIGIDLRCMSPYEALRREWPRFVLEPAMGSA